MERERGRRAQEVVVPYVTEGGEMTLAFGVAFAGRLAGGDALGGRWKRCAAPLKKEISIAADGRWRRVEVSFSSRQWLTYFAVGFGGLSGRVDCRRAALRRVGSAKPLVEWTFA